MPPAQPQQPQNLQASRQSRKERYAPLPQLSKHNPKINKENHSTLTLNKEQLWSPTHYFDTPPFNPEPPTLKILDANPPRTPSDVDPAIRLCYLPQQEPPA
ncbi:hypothetical protein C0989_001879 [Termitomyces sp. Mn162]|nr:hypothetical protein C0989_001879 [Termitomyces sp. Mn162]